MLGPRQLGQDDAGAGTCRPAQRALPGSGVRAGQGEARRARTSTWPTTSTASSFSMSIHLRAGPLPRPARPDRPGTPVPAARRALPAPRIGFPRSDAPVGRDACRPGELPGVAAIRRVGSRADASRPRPAVAARRVPGELPGIQPDDTEPALAAGLHPVLSGTRHPAARAAHCRRPPAQVLDDAGAPPGRGAERGAVGPQPGCRCEDRGRVCRPPGGSPARPPASAVARQRRQATS